MRSTVLFYITFVFCQVLAHLCQLFVGYWSTHWRGGFAWDGSILQANWHPVLMMSGMVILCGNAVLVYRVPCSWKQKKNTWKLVHAVLMLVALIVSILGMCAVFDFHRGYNIPHLYSLHSWVGMSTMVLFTFQWVLGLAGFLLPSSTQNFRSSLKPIHVWMGKAILGLSLICCISGINQNLFLALSQSGNEPYSSLPAEAKFANSLGLLIVAFGVVVFGILSNSKWQRPDTDKNESVHLLLHEDRT